MGDEHQRLTGAAGSTPGSEPSAPGGVGAVSARSLRVIAVDDEPGVLQVVEVALSMAGHRVQTFASLETSLAAFLEEPAAFDAAILDQHLGDGTGLELAEQMREANGTMCIVLASGRPSEELTRAAQALRVQLLPKPFSLQGLRATLGVS